MKGASEPTMRQPCDNPGTIAAESGCLSAGTAVAAFIHAGAAPAQAWGLAMNNIIYIVGLIVVVLVILSFLGLR
jgi:hypothetical protein